MVHDQHLATKAKPQRVHRFLHIDQEGKARGREDRSFHQEERLMSSMTVDTANRSDLHSAEVVHFTHMSQSRPVANQLSLSIVHTHRCTGGEIVTRSFG